MGNSVHTAAYTPSAVWWSVARVSARKIACRCGVTRRPLLRNNAVSSSTDLNNPNYETSLADRQWLLIPISGVRPRPHYRPRRVQLAGAPRGAVLPRIANAPQPGV